MKAASKILFCILGILVLICGVIVVRGLTRPVSAGPATVVRSEGKEPAEEKELTAKSSGGENNEIEALLADIDAKNGASTEAVEDADPEVLDLGLVGDVPYDSLESYYGEIVKIIADNHKNSSRILFDMKLNSELFGDWYKSNVNGKQESEQYTLLLDYEQLEDSTVLIHHDLQFKN